MVSWEHMQEENERKENNQYKELDDLSMEVRDWNKIILKKRRDRKTHLILRLLESDKFTIGLYDKDLKQFTRLGGNTGETIAIMPKKLANECDELCDESDDNSCWFYVDKNLESRINELTLFDIDELIKYAIVSIKREIARSRIAGSYEIMNQGYIDAEHYILSLPDEYYEEDGENIKLVDYSPFNK
jgi:hypothetical protein